MKIAIMGFGTVGKGAYEVAKTAGDIEVKRILARHGAEGYEDLDGIITADIADIAGDADIELVVESIGGIEPARTYVLECLNAGKHVVTPNKNLISACYKELTEAAEANGVELRFTPSVGGGIPWLHNLQRTKRCDVIEEVRGIVNGTCNYILDSMTESGADFGEMLAGAQELGYAEADPSADIEGTDTLRKTVISANLAFDSAVSEEDVPCFGIDSVSASDVEYLKSEGRVLRLHMKAARNVDGITAYVEPTAFPASAMEASVRLNNNLVTLMAEDIGTQSFYGQGAGMYPTGESVVQDILDIRDGIRQNAAKGVVDDESGANASKGAANETGGLKVNNDFAIHKYYVRVDDLADDIKGIAESADEIDGRYHCITEPISVTEMHALARKYKEGGKEIFIAGLAD